MPAGSPHDDDASMPAGTGSGSIYLIWAAGFVAVVVILAMLEQMGLPQSWLLGATLALTFAGWLAFALAGMAGEDGSSAGECSAPSVAILATVAGQASGLFFFAVAGAAFQLGHDGQVYSLGLTAGIALLAVLIAPRLQRTSATSLRDVFGGRSGGGKWGSAAGAFAIVAISLLLAATQIGLAGRIVSRVSGLDFGMAIAVVTLPMALCALAGGMRSVTMASAAMAVVLILAILVPLSVLSFARYGWPVPQAMLGRAVQEITSIEQGLLRRALADVRTLKAHATPFLSFDLTNWIALAFCLMAGTAAMPHLAMRALGTSTQRAARGSAIGVFMLLAVLTTGIIATAVFAKLELLSAIGAGLRLGDLPAWMIEWGRRGLLDICGVPATGVDVVVAACRGISRHPGTLRLQDFNLDWQYVVMALPQLGKLPFVMTALAAAGAMAALLCALDATLLAATSAVAPSTARDGGSWGRRGLALAAAIVAAALAAVLPPDPLMLLAWCTSLAAASLIPALLLALWWPRANDKGLAVGVAAGLVVTACYMIGTRYFAPGFYEMWSAFSDATPAAARRFTDLKQAWIAAPEGSAKNAAWTALDAHAQRIAGWWGIRHTASGLFGMAVAFPIAVIVSLMTPRRQAPVKQ